MRTFLGIPYLMPSFLNCRVSPPHYLKHQTKANFMLPIFYRITECRIICSVSTQLQKYVKCFFLHSFLFFVTSFPFMFLLEEHLLCGHGIKRWFCATNDTKANLTKLKFGINKKNTATLDYISLIRYENKTKQKKNP